MSELQRIKRENIFYKHFLDYMTSSRNKLIEDNKKLEDLNKRALKDYDELDKLIEDLKEWLKDEENFDYEWHVAMIQVDKILQKIGELEKTL